MIYNPDKIYIPTIKVQSAWGNIPYILPQIVKDFNINTNKCLEFGVEFGYSTSALAYIFDSVCGIDIFTGDIHSGIKSNFYEQTRKNLIGYNNIELIQSDYKDYIIKDNDFYDLIHIDIIHTYEDTYKCGEWAVQHSNCVIFHDTESFTDIKRVCMDLSLRFNLRFLNYNESNGLGILIRE